MKTIETRHGCYDAVRCGALDHHACGSPDACADVKPNGVVCTFGTTTRVTFHEQADIDAEMAEIEDAVVEIVRQGKVEVPVVAGLTAATFARKDIPAMDRAKWRAEVMRGKNIHSVAAEAESRASGKKHGDDNRAFHDANRQVFGH